MFLIFLIKNGVATLKGKFPYNVRGTRSGESHFVLDTFPSNLSEIYERFFFLLDLAFYHLLL